MKLDIKSILILVLLGLTLLFGFKWFFSGDNASKERVKQLEQEFKDLENQKKTVDLEITSWRAKSDSLKQLDIKLQAELVKQEAQTKKAEIEANRSRANLDKLRGDLAETQRKIEEIKNNPPNRTGDALLESLKNKTKN
jgi:predicted  nucleic acid-binding Zn-ribbon protein